MNSSFLLERNRAQIKRTKRMKAIIVLKKRKHIIDIITLYIFK